MFNKRWKSIGDRTKSDNVNSDELSYKDILSIHVIGGFRCSFYQDGKSLKEPSSETQVSIYPYRSLNLLKLGRSLPCSLLNTKASSIQVFKTHAGLVLSRSSPRYDPGPRRQGSHVPPPNSRLSFPGKPKLVLFILGVELNTITF